MSPRVSLPVIPGHALDRSSGALIQQPSTWRQLVNFLPREGKLVARQGLTETATLKQEIGGTEPVELAQDTLHEGATDVDLRLHIPSTPMASGWTLWEVHGVATDYYIWGTFTGFRANGGPNTVARTNVAFDHDRLILWSEVYRLNLDQGGDALNLCAFIPDTAIASYNSRDFLFLSVARISPSTVSVRLYQRDSAGAAIPLTAGVTVAHAINTSKRYVLKIERISPLVWVAKSYTRDATTGLNETLLETVQVPDALTGGTHNRVGLAGANGVSPSGGMVGYLFTIEGGTVRFGGGTDIVDIFPFRAIRSGVVVTYNRTTRDLDVHIVDAEGKNPQLIGTWGTLPAGAPLPLVRGAELYGKFFLAHAEPLFNYRIKTIYFDPELALGAQLVDLTADLDRQGAAGIKFRGVYAWSSYLVGWGFGTNSDQDRPEILRLSDAGDPTTLRPESYFIAGARKDAIITCVQEAGALKVFKAGLKFVVTGSDQTNFGIEPEEEAYGCAGDRLATAWGPDALVWSEDGPRIHAGGGRSVDLAIPLDLPGVDPVDMPAKGLVRYGWVVRDPDERAFHWGFPDLDNGVETFIYTLSHRDPTVLRWSYQRVKQLLYSAGLVLVGSPTVGTSPTAYASNLVANDTGVSGTGRQVTLDFDTNALIGDETWEVFGRPSGGTWSVLSAFAASGTGSESLTVPGFDALADYDIAVRAVRRGIATPGYESDNPDLWTASTAGDSETTVETTCSAPVLTTIAWQRIDADTQRLTITLTLAELGVGLELQDSPDGSTGWALVHTYPTPTDDRSVTFDPPNTEAGTARWYRMRAVRATLLGPYSAAKRRFLGLDTTPIPEFHIYQSTITQDFDLWLTSKPASHILEVETSADLSTWVREFLSATVSAPQNIASSVALASTTHVRARYRVPGPGPVDDIGEWSAVQDILLTNEAAPSAPSAFTSVNYASATAITCHFGAGGGSNGRVIRYFKNGDDDGFGFSEVNSAATSAVLADLFHEAVTHDFGVDYDYTVDPGLASADAVAASFVVIRTGGRAKVSAETAEAIPTTIDSAPTGLLITSPGLGQITVTWANHATGTTDVRWALASGGPEHKLAAPVATPGTSVNGPGAGFAALPGSGTSIHVRVWHRVTVGGTVYRTAWVQTNYVI
jgi:hypothetical protein